MDAMQCMLGVPELLESILLHLPTRDLLLAQRVSQRWVDVISTSPSLQQALFFQPASDTRTRYEFNDLLAEYFPMWFRQHIGYQGMSCAAFEQLTWAEDSAKSEAVMREEASWRRMLVCQPAVGLVVRQIMETVVGRKCCEARLETNGLRMGDLYDLTQKWVFEGREATFGVHWSNFPTAKKVFKAHSIALGELAKVKPSKSAALVRLDLIVFGVCSVGWRPRDDKRFISEGREIDIDDLVFDGWARPKIEEEYPETDSD